MTKSLETKRSFLSVSRIVLAVLMCLLFTGCALLDIKDKGGMVNPDAVSEEETGVAENETENDMSRFMKKKTETESDTEITADGDQPVRKPVRENNGWGNPKNGFQWHLDDGDREECTC